MPCSEQARPATASGHARQGGRFFCGPDSIKPHCRAARYIDCILKGDLSVQAPTKCQLVNNLNTARALGLEAPRAHALVLPALTQAAYRMQQLRLHAVTTLLPKTDSRPVGGRILGMTESFDNAVQSLQQFQMGGDRPANDDGPPVAGVRG